MKQTTSFAKGFTLSELLIAIAILGLIATFTIPKVLQSVGNSTNKAIGKETASVISQAYDGLKADGNGSVPNTVTAGTLMAKINYVQALASGTMAGITCATPGADTTSCYQLHNGGILVVDTGDTFGTDNTGGLVFSLDPDGATGTNTAVSFVLGHDGRIMTGGVADNGAAEAAPFNTYDLTGGLTPITTDPSWFSWN
jgi:prepilin-type N-terminal cleavage/methylation domain-containing protein